jgi:thioredoxin:protein disulfide reductase
VKRGAGVALLVAAVLYARPFLFYRTPVPSESALPWISTESEGLRRARESRKPAMIDFWASWCESCLDLDRETFSDPRVVAALRERFVVIRIDESQPTREAEGTATKYGVNALPTILFVDPDGNRLPGATVHNFIEPDRFLDLLARVRGAVTKR